METNFNIIGFTVKNIKIKKYSHGKNVHSWQNKYNINECYCDNSNYHIHQENNYSKDYCHTNIITIKISKHNFVSSSLGYTIVCDNAWEVYKKNIYNYIHVPFILTFTKKHNFNSIIFKLIKIKCYKEHDFIKLYLKCDKSHIDNHEFLCHKNYDNIRFKEHYID